MNMMLSVFRKEFVLDLLLQLVCGWLLHSLRYSLSYKTPYRGVHKREIRRQQDRHIKNKKEKHLKEPQPTQKYTRQRSKKCQHTDHYQKPEKSGHKPQKSNPRREKHECQGYDADATTKNE